MCDIDGEGARETPRRLGGIEVATARLDVAPATVLSLARSLADSEARRAWRYHFERDRRRFIVARARLRQMLAARLDTRPEAVELTYGPNGKPALGGKQATTGWRFNVSHCDDFAVYAFSQGREVGVDVEALRTLPEADAIAAHYFSPREHAAYLSLAPRDKPLGFFQAWTRKEAFLKALGLGIAHARDDFDVSLAPGEPARILRVADTAGDDSGWRLESFFPARGFVAALVCGRRPSGPM